MRERRDETTHVLNNTIIMHYIIIQSTSFQFCQIFNIILVKLDVFSLSLLTGYGPSCYSVSIATLLLELGSLLTPEVGGEL